MSKRGSQGRIFCAKFVHAVLREGIWRTKFVFVDCDDEFVAPNLYLSSVVNEFVTVNSLPVIAVNEFQAVDVFTAIDKKEFSAVFASSSVDGNEFLAVLAFSQVGGNEFLPVLVFSQVRGNGFPFVPKPCRTKHLRVFEENSEATHCVATISDSFL